MARKKLGLFGSLRNRVFAGIASLLATAGTSLTAYYWNSLVGHQPGESHQTSGDGPGGAPLPALAIQKKPAATKIGLLGCQATESEKRVRITEVPPGSTAALLGLVPGDIVEEVDNHRIESAEALAVRLAQSRPFLRTTIEVRRGATPLRGEVTLASDTALTVHRPLRPQ